MAKNIFGIPFWLFAIFFIVLLFLIWKSKSNKVVVPVGTEGKVVDIGTTSYLI